MKTDPKKIGRSKSIRIPITAYNPVYGSRPNKTEGKFALKNFRIFVLASSERILRELKTRTRIFARKNFREQRYAHKTEFQNAQKFLRDANEKNKSTTCTWNRPRILRIDFPKNAKIAFFQILPNSEGKIQKSELPYMLFIRKTVVLRIDI